MLKRTKETSEKLGKKVQKFRKELGVSQEQFAFKLGISRTHAGHIEQGRRSPSLKLLERIARSLKIPISELFTHKK